MRPFAAPGAYVNYLGGDEGAGMIQIRQPKHGATVVRLSVLLAHTDGLHCRSMGLRHAAVERNRSQADFAILSGVFDSGAAGQMRHEIGSYG